MIRDMAVRHDPRRPDTFGDARPLPKGPSREDMMQYGYGQNLAQKALLVERGQISEQHFLADKSITGGNKSIADFFANQFNFIRAKQETSSSGDPEPVGAMAQPVAFSPNKYRGLLTLGALAAGFYYVLKRR